MAFTNKYPYTDNHELNLDWVLSKITGLDDRFKSIEDAIESIENDLSYNIKPAITRLENGLSDFQKIVNAFLNYDGLEYNEALNYKVGDFCFYEGVLYRCTHDTTGAFFPQDWQMIFLSTVVEENMKAVRQLFDDIAEEFTSDDAYDVGDFVLLDGVFYEVTAPIAIGDPDYLSKMSKTNIADKLNNAALIDVLFNPSAYEYNTTTSYVYGDMVLYEGKLYYCNLSTSGVFDPSKWTESTIFSILKQINMLALSAMDEMAAVRGMIADDYNTSNTYSVGDYVLFNHYLYKAIRDVPASYNPGAYPAYWEVVSIVDSFTPKTEYRGTLLAGDGGFNIYPVKANQNSVIEIFTSVFGLSPTNIELRPIGGGQYSLEVSFDLQDDDFDYVVRIS